MAEGMINNWPLQRNMSKFYGPPGNGLVHYTPPFIMHYGEHPIINFFVNKNCVASLDRVFKNLWDQSQHKQSTIDKWGLSKFSGCYNDRNVRGSLSISVHAYGAAVDLNAEENPLQHGFDPTTAKPLESKFWEGHPVVKAFKAEDWIWGGNWHGRQDPMHFQAARVK